MFTAVHCQRDLILCTERLCEELDRLYSPEIFVGRTSPSPLSDFILRSPWDIYTVAAIK